MKPFLLLLPLLLICSCRQQVQTYTLEEARAWLDMVDNTMSRGIDYLGSDSGFHYFEINREFAPDPRFRIARESALYADSDTHPYRRWHPKHTPACEELKGLHLYISEESGTFRYQLENRVYTSPADIPANQWQHVRYVILGDKSLTVSGRMQKSIAPYLQGRNDIRYSSPISGMPESETGAINSQALDALIQGQR